MPKMAGWLIFAFLLTVALSAQSQAKTRLSDIVKQAKPAIVTVTAYDSEGKTTGQAGGFFIDSSNVVTNWQAVNGASRIKVITSDGTTLSVQNISAGSRKSGVANLLLNASYPGNHYLKVTDVYPYQGERVFIIKCPPASKCTGWEGNVITVRELPGADHLIQFQSSIKEDINGSPLVNTKGQVVGVVRGDLSRNQSTHYAVPGEQLLALQNKAVTYINGSTGAGTGRGPTVPQDTPLRKGIALENAGNYEQSIPLLEEAAKSEPNNHAAWFSLGHSYFMMDRYAESIKAFNKAISLKPNFAAGYTALGYALATNHQPKEATDAFKQALKLDPNDAYAHYGLGGIYVRAKNRDAALDEYEILKKLDSNLAGSLLDLIADQF